MKQEGDTLRAQLLARLPQPANYAAYQEQVAAEIAKSEKRLRLEKRIAAALWIFAVVFSLLLTVWRGESWMSTPHGHMAEFSCLLLFIWGAVQLLGSAINGSRIAILKEVKQLQIQVLELQASSQKKSDGEA
jgi:hypothetical protein